MDFGDRMKLNMSSATRDMFDFKQILKLLSRMARRQTDQSHRLFSNA